MMFLLKKKKKEFKWFEKKCCSIYTVFQFFWNKGLFVVLILTEHCICSASYCFIFYQDTFTVGQSLMPEHFDFDLSFWWLICFHVTCQTMASIPSSSVVKRPGQTALCPHCSSSTCCTMHWIRQKPGKGLNGQELTTDLPMITDMWAVWEDI